MNIKRIYRLYKLEGLNVRYKQRKKRASHLRVVPPAPTAANERWSMDFMRDTFDDGRPFRILTVVDVFTRECPLLARKKLEAWRRDYNQNRPHSAIGHLTPVEYANQIRTEDRTLSEVS